ncbi:hypothetical protein EOD42_00685 [Rhodovarius crocodyli]|uniref:Class I SAM-dependent methyltransferase n=1 Tax=Rhodovarius crocodyli TaxID=1979269 RepID=A0A437MLX3_9PROT|nr:hypothetical protein [Rhodovarius crocodyli]RVT98664.1 hypothetical protein EOD42_00685 [Rhodovarius crocodyli]
MTLPIDARRYFGLEQPARIRAQLDIHLSEHCFAPTPEEPEADWLASVATPAFRILARTGPRRSFLSIGTGCGLGAVEILGAEQVAVTDIFEDIVQAAALNFVANLAPGVTVPLTARTGDLVAPLADSGLRFDLVYENLPNTPVADAGQLARGQTVAGFLAPRAEEVPPLLKDRLLVLHYLALRQVRPLLNPGGAVLSTIGARIPLDSFAALAEAAGYRGRLLTYGWKKQAAPEEYIPGYIAMEREGLGPFHFYRADTLRAAFAGLAPEEAGAAALAIEQDLKPHSLTATEALAAHRAGEAVGHAVVALLSEAA